MSMLEQSIRCQITNDINDVLPKTEGLYFLHVLYGSIRETIYVEIIVPEK